MQAATAPALRMVFYGDDFTGSTDALEVLTAAGLKCALFLTPPTAQLIETMGGFDVIGIAGDSRGLSNAEMDQALPAVFQAIKQLSPALVHYKVCSTFDSAANVGNIGHVIGLASGIFQGKGIPIVAGNPVLGRYCVFGNLYALSRTDHQVHRIDRHPVMRAHPITPMHEADLGLHIGQQNALDIARIDIRQLEQDDGLTQLVSEMAHNRDAILFDGTTDAHMTSAARVLSELASSGSPLFVVGSSGVEYGLTQYWQAIGTIPSRCPQLTPLKAVKQVLVISGSASPLSSSQIDNAVSAGFAELAIDAAALVVDSQRSAALRGTVTAALDHLQAGRSVVIHTAKGARDPRIEQMIDAMAATGLGREEARIRGGRQLAIGLGHLVQDILEAYPLERLVVSGGDTSSQITKVLGPDALTIKSFVAPGAPLCQLHSQRPHLEHLEIALKGGQMGDPDYFVKTLKGH